MTEATRRRLLTQIKIKKGEKKNWLRRKCNNQNVWRPFQFMFLSVVQIQPTTIRFPWCVSRFDLQRNWTPSEDETTSLEQLPLADVLNLIKQSVCATAYMESATEEVQNSICQRRIVTIFTVHLLYWNGFFFSSNLVHYWILKITSEAGEALI